MTYHSTSHPIHHVHGMRLRALGGIDQATTDGTGMFMTSLTPYNVSQVMAQFVPSTLATKLQGAGLITVSDSTGWSSDGHVWAKYLAGSKTDAARQAALTAAVRATETAIGSGVHLLLPGESAPSGSTLTPLPPSVTPTDPLVPTSSSVVLPAAQLQNFLIGHGFDIGTVSASGTFNSNSSAAMNQAVAATGASGAFTVSGDGSSVTVPSNVWTALAMLPTKPPARTSGTAPVMPPVLPGAAPAGTGPDWGSIAPWIVVGGIALLGVGFFFYEEKKRPRTTHTVRNARRRRPHPMDLANQAWLDKHSFTVMDGERAGAGHKFKGGGAYLEAMRELQYQRGLGHDDAWVRDDSTGERA